MKEVAALAGVSLSTVSRVVNDDPAVRADLAERVRRAVGSLGYRHNATASALRRNDGLSASIGLIVEDVGNPFFSAVHRGIEEVARERGVLTFAGSSDELDDARAAARRGVRRARRRRPHHRAGRPATTASCCATARPAWRSSSSTAPAASSTPTPCSPTTPAVPPSAVDHLVAAGHRRIGFLGDRPDLYTAAERLRGFEAALARHGLAADPALVRHTMTRAADAYETTRELLLGDDPPTAIFTSQNLITIDAVRALHDLGVARSVALVGFDDVVLGDVVEPGLTVLAQDPVGLGRTAAELLFSRLDGDDGPTQQIVLAPTLVARGSGELPAGAAR